MESMIEQTRTSGCECTEQIPAMEASISHGTVRRSREPDVTTSDTGKRRRFASHDAVQDNAFQLQYLLQRDVNSQNNVVSNSTAVSGTTSDHVNSCSVNDDSISDLKAEEIEIFMSSNGGCRDSSVVCSEAEEEIDSILTSKKKRKKTPVNEPVAKMPTPAELDEYFAKAEEYEQKRFAKKYNYDIVNDVPTAGRYQWVRYLKP